MRNTWEKLSWEFTSVSTNGGECRVQIETETDSLRPMNEAEFVEVTVRERLQEKQQG